MGLDIMAELGLTLHPATGTIYSVKDEAEEQPVLPAIRNYQHRIVLRKGTLPIRHSLRRLPLSVREQVSQELRRLEAGVIERVDTSEWVNPIVVAPKKNGSIRLCVDLRGAQ